MRALAEPGQGRRIDLVVARFEEVGDPAVAPAAFARPAKARRGPFGAAIPPLKPLTSLIFLLAFGPGRPFNDRRGLAANLTAEPGVGPGLEQKEGGKMGLTEKRIAKLRDKGRYLDTDGLYLQVGPTGSKSWLLRFELNHRERFMGLGKLSDFTLVEARERARKARQLLADGIDPIEKRLAERDIERRAASDRVSFKEAAEQFLQMHEPTWDNAKHRQQWRNTMREFVYPALGARPVVAIDRAVINDALAPIWTKIPSTAGRVRSRIERVLKWVKDGRPLPSNGSKETRNHAALLYGEIPGFVAALRAQESVAARALEFTILTVARTGETIGARWSEFDFMQKIWTVPAGRMNVPLTDSIIALLNDLPREADNPFCFIGSRPGKNIHSDAMLELLQRSGHTAKTVHGFRSSFRDFAAEQTHFPREICEAALAHKVAVDGTEAAYLRTDLLDKRRKLMECWVAFCNRPADESGTVVALHAG
jgi:integrase